jgi:hypothetical protein
MPKIFEYLGIVIFFYSNEHEPIHVHAKHGGYQSRAEFVLKNGKIIKITIKAVAGWEPLRSGELKNFSNFLNEYSDQVLKKWIDFFVLKKKVTFEKITKRVK